MFYYYYNSKKYHLLEPSTSSSEEENASTARKNTMKVAVCICKYINETNISQRKNPSSSRAAMYPLTASLMLAIASAFVFP